MHSFETRWTWIVMALATGCATSAAGAPRRDGGGRPEPEDTLSTCSDGIDGDFDGATDCADPDCAPFSVCAVPGGDAGGPWGADGGPVPTEDGGFVGCAGFVAMADPVLLPVDIVWTVDSSSSMANDALAVQANLDDFAAYIAASGIDFRVVLISDRDFVAPSPLFSSDPAHFLFVDRGVGSSAVFARTLDQFPFYRSFLRPDAITHVIGVTDDEDDVGAASFVADMQARLGHPFTFHAIAATAGPFGLPCARGFIPAAAVGDRYFAAARSTGGLELSICTSDWSGLFTTLGTAVSVSSEIPCTFEIPAPPDGMTFDRTLVNVVHAPAGAPAATVPYAGDAAACGGGVAWHYDDAAAPTRILLCPAACAALSSGPGTLEIQLGCETVLF